MTTTWDRIPTRQALPYLAALTRFVRERLSEDRQEAHRYHFEHCDRTLLGEVYPCDCDGPERWEQTVDTLRRVADYEALPFDARVRLVEILAVPYARHPRYPTRPPVA